MSLSSEFEGIKLFNIFKYFEDNNVLTFEISNNIPQDLMEWSKEKQLLYLINWNMIDIPLERAIEFLKFEITKIVDGIYNVEIKFAPMYFMNMLSGVMAGEVHPFSFATHKLPTKLLTAKGRVIISYGLGIEHPHFIDSYIIKCENGGA